MLLLNSSVCISNHCSLWCFIQRFERSEQLLLALFEPFAKTKVKGTIGRTERTTSRPLWLQANMQH